MTSNQQTSECAQTAGCIKTLQFQRDIYIGNENRKGPIRLNSLFRLPATKEIHILQAKIHKELYQA